MTIQVQPGTDSLRSRYIQVRRGGVLLFEYDPERYLIRIKPKGQHECFVVDLLEYLPAGSTAAEPRAGEVKEV